MLQAWLSIGYVILLAILVLTASLYGLRWAAALGQAVADGRCAGQAAWPQGIAERAT